MLDEKTQAAVSGIRATLLVLAERLAELKEPLAAIESGPEAYRVDGVVFQLKTVHDNLRGLDVTAAVDELLEAEDEGWEWVHPVTVLGRIRPPDAEIRHVCRRRRLRARGANRERLAKLLKKLKYSRQLLEAAQQRRKKRRR